MLYTIAVVLVLLWLLGMVLSYTINGLIHLLLIWIYYSAYIMILGAEFTSQCSRMRYSVTT